MRFWSHSSLIYGITTLTYICFKKIILESLRFEGHFTLTRLMNNLLVMLNRAIKKSLKVTRESTDSVTDTQNRKHVPSEFRCYGDNWEGIFLECQNFQSKEGFLKKPSVTELGERLFNKKCVKPSRLQQNGRFDLKNAPLWLVRYSEKEHKGLYLNRIV